MKDIFIKQVPEIQDFRESNFTELDHFSISWKLDSSAGNLTLLMKNIILSLAFSSARAGGPGNVEYSVFVPGNHLYMNIFHICIV